MFLIVKISARTIQYPLKDLNLSLKTQLSLFDNNKSNSMNQVTAPSVARSMNMPTTHLRYSKTEACKVDIQLYPSNSKTNSEFTSATSHIRNHSTSVKRGRTRHHQQVRTPRPTHFSPTIKFFYMSFNCILS